MSLQPGQTKPVEPPQAPIYGRPLPIRGMKPKRLPDVPDKPRAHSTPDLDVSDAYMEGGPRLKDLPLVLAGGYPPEYVQSAPTVSATPTILTTCPAGVWRVILRAHTWWSVGNASSVIHLSVTRSGTNRTIATPDQAIYSAAYKYQAQLISPLILMPGDSLCFQEVSTAANTVNACCSFVDVQLR